MKTTQVTTKKSKKNSSTICTLQQAQEADKIVAEKSTKLEKIKAQMNEELTEVKEKYSDEITVIKEELDESEKILELYAKEQRANWGDRKSIEMLHTVIGFKNAPPKVSKQKQFTWEAVLELLKKNRNFKSFIRVKEEINKEAILSLNATNEKDQKILQLLKQECYLSIEQGENFFATPKKEALKSV